LAPAGSNERTDSRALGHEEEGLRGEVRQEVGKVLEYSRKLAKKSPKGAEAIEALEGESVLAAQLMSAMELKLAHYSSSRGRRRSRRQAMKESGTVGYVVSRSLAE
jgi:hypothetical protein